MDVHIDTISTNGFTMDYCRFGRGDAPLVILPGVSVQRVMTSAKAIAGAYRAMTDAFTVYVFERRNDLPGGCSIEDMARDTAAALDALALGPACVFGASQGGMIAMALALHAPERVRKLALGSTSARVTPGQYAPLENWVRLARAGDAKGLYLAFGQALYPKAMFEAFRDALIELSKTVTREDLARFIVQTEALRGFDLLKDLNDIACPVLVLGARDDRVLGGEASEAIAAHFKNRPDCALHMYDGYGHAAYDTAPDYKARLLNFFTARAPGRCH